MANVAVVDYVDSSREYELDTKRTKKISIFFLLFLHIFLSTWKERESRAGSTSTSVWVSKTGPSPFELLSKWAMDNRLLCEHFA